MNYHITVSAIFFDKWLKNIEAWKQKSDKDKDSLFLLNMIDEFLTEAQINKMISTKYNDFKQEVYQRYVIYIKNQIYKILPLAEEKGEWSKHLDTLLTELQGANSVFVQSINFISLINKLETLKDYSSSFALLTIDEIKDTEDFKVFRKTIFECMNIAESLNVVWENGN